MFYKSSIVFILLFTAVSVLGQKVEQFETQNGMTRYFSQGMYHFVNATNGSKLVLNGFTYAGDFSDDRAVVKGKRNASYGAIDKQGNLVIDTTYNQILTSHFGYMLVAKRVPGFVYEDRGHGYQKYNREVWMLAQSETGYILDEIKFQSISHINGIVSGVDLTGKKLTINVQKINIGYYDPFMKAVEQIDQKLVKSTFNSETGTVTYTAMTTNEVIISHPINRNPQEKYR